MLAAYKLATLNPSIPIHKFMKSAFFAVFLLVLVEKIKFAFIKFLKEIIPPNFFKIVISIAVFREVYP